MIVLLPLAILAAAFAALLSVPPQTPLLGLDHARFAQGAFGLALLSGLFAAGARRAGSAGVARVMAEAATWALLLVLLVGAYGYRAELADFADRVIAELVPGEPQVGKGGEVIIPRRLGGEFVVAAKVNDRAVAMLFDTGASAVVLRAEDAARAGVNLSGLDYDVGVVTANGNALAASVRLDKLSVGPIVVRNVRALVARPEALSESLLGMSFLEKLQSYSVERGKLVFKGR